VSNQRTYETLKKSRAAAIYMRGLSRLGAEERFCNDSVSAKLLVMF
jgi:hypothetical protein